ncbi:MAG: acyl--CoA ligase [Bacilli bacterium]|nr:acyl--CoA ligase [Bacilli bacterium]
MTLFHERFQNLCRRFGERLLLDDDLFGVYSIQETYQLSLFVAKRLLQDGWKVGEAMIIKATRNASTTILIYATQFAGIIAFPIDPRIDSADLEKTDPRVKGLAVQSDSENIRFWTLIHDGKESVFEIPLSLNSEKDFMGVNLEENADALWVLTSGSEGSFKIVRHSQEGLFSHFERYEKPSSCDEKDRGIVLLPLFHVFGLALILFPIHTGFSLFFPANLDLDYLIDYTIRKEITYFDTVPSFHYVVAKRVQERGIHFTKLRNGLTAGAPMEESRFREIEESLGMKLLPVYGASELIGISGLGEKASEERRRNTVGQLVPGTEIKILDENGRKRKVGEAGEIVVRSPSLMLGYLGKDSGLDEEGFFHTGDIGYLDENADLHISGRKKAIIIRNGNNLSQVEIENRLLHIEGVEFACVIGLPDEEDGEVPGALLVLKEGAKPDMVLAKIKKDLPKNLWPKHIRFVNVLPQLASGKVDRIKAKEMLLKSEKPL